MIDLFKLLLILLLTVGVPVTPLTTPATESFTPCPEGTVPLPGTDQCTHGPDPPPPGSHITDPVRLIPERKAQRIVESPPCDGDGQSGYRVQALYVREAGTPSRYAQTLPNIQVWVGEIDRIVATNAQDTGGMRHVRWVHDAACAPIIPEIVIPDGALLGFSQSIQALEAKGLTRADRIYLAFSDTTAAGICGIGTMWGDDRAGEGNASNSGPGYARADAGCWTPAVAAHELFHNLGAVQESAPNTSHGGHCIDEYDIMCYSDSPNYPQMRIDCPDRAADTTLLDCGHQDYFNVAPSAGNYLAGHWNTANNRFLTPGGPAPPPPTAVPTVPPPMPTAAPTPPAKNCHKIHNKDKRKKCKQHQ